MLDLTSSALLLLHPGSMTSGEWEEGQFSCNLEVTQERVPSVGSLILQSMAFPQRHHCPSLTSMPLTEFAQLAQQHWNYRPHTVLSNNEKRLACVNISASSAAHTCHQRTRGCRKASPSSVLRWLAPDSTFCPFSSPLPLLMMFPCWKVTLRVPSTEEANQGQQPDLR